MLSNEDARAHFSCYIPAGSTPSEDGIILPHPFEGEFFSYDARDAPVLGVHDGDGPDDDIVLVLPPGVKAEDLRWLSVWCRAFTVNFGDVVFPEDLGAAAAVDERNEDTKAGEDYEYFEGQFKQPFLVVLC